MACIGLGDSAVTFFLGSGGIIAAAAGVVLIATVFAAVYHAEVVAHRIGEPFGTLVLAVAVTVIEVALIVSVMVAAPAEKAGLARDTVFAAVMIVCNGIVGLCLLWGGARHHEQGFQVHGASAALAVLAALTTLTLILPNCRDECARSVCSAPRSSSSRGLSRWCSTARSFSSRPCGTATISLQLNQTTRKRTRLRPPDKTALVSAGLLLAALVAVVGLAKSLTPTLEVAVARLDVPKAVVGIVIAGLVLLPEGLAALGRRAPTVCRPV